MSQNAQIARRLGEICKVRFNGSPVEFARALKMSYENLAGNYLSGKSKPGPKIQDRLREIGEDVEWIMTGKTASSVAKDLTSYQIDKRIATLEKENLELRRENEALRDLLVPIASAVEIMKRKKKGRIK